MNDRSPVDRVQAAPAVASTPEAEKAPKEKPEVKAEKADTVTIQATDDTNVERIAFAGSHDVDGADDDGYVTLPAQVTPAQAAVAVGASGVEVAD